jgi:hypothetical protein
VTNKNPEPAGSGLDDKDSVSSRDRVTGDAGSGGLSSGTGLEGWFHARDYTTVIAHIKQQPPHFLLCRCERSEAIPTFSPCHCEHSDLCHESGKQPPPSKETASDTTRPRSDMTLCHCERSDLCHESGKRPPTPKETASGTARPRSDRTLCHCEQGEATSNVQGDGFGHNPPSQRHNPYVVASAATCATKVVSNLPIPLMSLRARRSNLQRPRRLLRAQPTLAVT